MSPHIKIENFKEQTSIIKLHIGFFINPVFEISNVLLNEILKETRNTRLAVAGLTMQSFNSTVPEIAIFFDYFHRSDGKMIILEFKGDAWIATLLGGEGTNGREVQIPLEVLNHIFKKIAPRKIKIRRLEPNKLYGYVKSNQDRDFLLELDRAQKK